MQPLVADNLPLIGVLVASVLIWRVLETIVEIRSFKRLRRVGVRRQDNGSKVALIGLFALGGLLGALVAVKLPIAAVTPNMSARIALFWLGMLLFAGGVALRLYAIHMLGAYFTTDVAIAPDQTVVETGSYRFIRHPSYTGILLALLGTGLIVFANWLSVLALMGCILLGIAYRIAVEERTLQSQLGQPYQEYMQRTKRLIPFVI